jgi:hypothetical protein
MILTNNNNLKNLTTTVMRTILVVLALLILTDQKLFATEGEVIIANYSTKQLRVEVYPIGAIFNAEKEYNPECVFPYLNHYNFIVGGSKVLNKFEGSPQRFTLDHDASGDIGAEAAIGYGRYRIVFIQSSSDTTFEDGPTTYCDIDYTDADFPYTGWQFMQRDVHIQFYSIQNIEYNWDGDPVPIPVDRLLISWDQRTVSNPNSYKTQNRNGFRSHIDYKNWPINAMNYGASNHLYFDKMLVNFDLVTQGNKIQNHKSLQFDSARLKCDSLLVELGNNSKLEFEGINSYLDIRPNSSLLFGDSSGIEFRNGAYIKANGAEFRVENSFSAWSGINFYNSGNDSIINCTFSNAKTAVSFINDEQHKFTNRIIKNCTFNIPTGGDYKGIYGENNYSILVEGNRFKMPASPGGSPFYTGLYLKNVTPSSPPEAAGEEGATATPYSLNIVNNTFRNGSSGIVLANYTSNLLPYYIKGNRFDSLDAHAATVNIIGMKITGIIKDNVLSSSQSPIGIHLINSSPNLLNNIVNARDVALHLDVSSYANLAPNIYNNQTYWSGGRNTLSSFLYDNIQLAYIGNAYTDYGRNKFTVSNDSAYHIYGWLDTNVLRYHSRDNCWYTSGAAKIYLRHPGATMPVLFRN